MTGFGEARLQDQRWSIEVEVRTVNNRHLKLTAKISEPYAALEPELERLVRETVRRGTVQISVRVERPRQAEDYRLNTVALASYRDQLRRLQGRGRRWRRSTSASLLVLPGVVEELRPPATTRTRTGRRSPAWSPRRSTSLRRPGPRKAGRWPRSCSRLGRAIDDQLGADRRPRARWSSSRTRSG